MYLQEITIEQLFIISIQEITSKSFYFIQLLKIKLDTNFLFFLVMHPFFIANVKQT